METEMGYRGSKSIIYYYFVLIMIMVVKEQRVDGSYIGSSKSIWKATTLNTHLTL